MTEQQMIAELERARKFSEDMHTIVWAMSNGSKIKYTDNETYKNFLKNSGYWTCSIFQYGMRAEA